MFNFFKLLKKDEIDNPPYDYNFLLNLNEKEYPKYLKKIFKTMTGEELNLKHPKTFNEKIQWLKLYDSTPLKTQLTDKILVRDWVKEKIGEEYLKPLLWKGKNFDDIPFEKLPEKFIIKANNGSKWQFKIKDKASLLDKKDLYNFIRLRFNGWMEQNFFPVAGFEMQYKNIKPQILIEPLLIENENNFPIEYEIYCFNGIPKIYQKIIFSTPSKCCVYNEDFTQCDLTFNSEYEKFWEEPNEYIKKAVYLSKILSKGFKLVRVDWMQHINNLYFNEMTFTPFSGFFIFNNQKWNSYLGKLLYLNKE